MKGADVVMEDAPSAEGHAAASSSGAREGGIEACGCGAPRPPLPPFRYGREGLISNRREIIAACERRGRWLGQRLNCPIHSRTTNRYGSDVEESEGVLNIVSSRNNQSIS